MNVITLGEPLVEFYRRETGKPFSEVGNFVGPLPAGAPAIFADTVTKLGHSCGFFGVVGEDDFGELVKKKLKNDGVDVSRIRGTSKHTTGTSFATYFEDGSRKFIFHLTHAAAGQLSPDDIDSEYISSAEFLHVMGSTLSVSDSAKKACYKAIKKSDGKISFDPNLRPELLDIDLIRKICTPVLKNCDIVLPNVDEAKILTGERKVTESVNELLNMGVETAAVKMGRRGTMVATSEETIRVAPFSVKEVDPTGAGDSHDAAFVCGLLEGKSLEEAARLANAVGALSVTERGGMEGIPTRESVNRLMKKECDRE